MNVKENEWLPKKKIRYQFTCFICPGDLDDLVSCSEGEDYGSSRKVELKDEKKIKSMRTVKEIPSSLHSNNGEDNEQNDISTSLQKAALELVIEKSNCEKLENEKRLIREGYKSHDGEDQLVYSRIIGVPPKSFITTATSYDSNSPPPVYLSDLELVNCRKTKKEEFMAGFSIPPEGGLLCVDQEILDRQSGVLTDMLKQFFTKFSIERISLPVRIFEPRSTCERIVDLWRFAPYYLSNAAASKDPLQRFKQVIAFAVSGMYCSAQQLKPFNPLLGETLEGSFIDGTQIYVEHTSHHPPMSHFYMLGPNDSYKMHGYYIYRINMSGNTLSGQQEGPNHIEFSNGQRITFSYPKIKIHGMIMGKRMIYPSGVMTFDDPVSRLRAAVVFNYGKSRGLFSSRIKNTKIDDFEGILYYAKRGSKQPAIEQLKELTDVERPVGQISGSWLKSLKISGTTFWDIDKVQPYLLEYEKTPLPSDWRFREDLIWLRRDFMAISQEWKIRLEAEQRRDEKLRKSFK